MYVFPSAITAKVGKELGKLGTVTLHLWDQMPLHGPIMASLVNKLQDRKPRGVEPARRMSLSKYQVSRVVYRGPIALWSLLSGSILAAEPLVVDHMQIMTTAVWHRHS